MPFRTTAQLGPEIDSKGPYHWDFQPGVDVSYRLGNKETGSDGHEYVMVRAGGTIAAGGGVTIDEATWTATAGAGGFTVPPAITGGVVLNDYFQARRTAI